MFRRVHISRATLDCLNGQFNVEPGNGGDRSSYLANNKIDTFLVIPVEKRVSVQAPQISFCSKRAAPKSNYFVVLELQRLKIVVFVVVFVLRRKRNKVMAYRELNLDRWRESPEC